MSDLLTRMRSAATLGAAIEALDEGAAEIERLTAAHRLVVDNLSERNAECERLRDVLRHVQWAELKMEGMDGPSVYVCVACGSVKPNDHQPRCSIDAALGDRHE